MNHFAGILSSLLFAACAAAPDPLAGPAVAAPQVSESVSLATESGVIEGTLLIPGRTDKVPVALIIAGSGPTDRDGNSRLLPGKNDSLRMLAEELAANGIASLRFDKRGIGASAAAGPSEADLRFDHYVADAAGWLGLLRRDDRFSTITVIGHSEGSLIGMIAAHTAGADGFVSIAGTGRSAPEVLREQLRPQLPEELWNESERVLNQLIAGETVADPPLMLASLYRPSVQPYLISWFAHDPVTEIARLKIPALLVQGTTDIQIRERDAELLHAAARDGDLAIIEGMNHVLKIVDADTAKQIASYSDPSLPIAPELVSRIVGFIKRR